MREVISKTRYKTLKKQYEMDDDCCLIKLDGKKLVNKSLYFAKLEKKLRLNDTFSNNYNAYSDMMCDPYTYYNKDKIIFMIKNYDLFLGQDDSKKIIEKIFERDIIPFFESEVGEVLQDGGKKEIHIYCVETGGNDD